MFLGPVIVTGNGDDDITQSATWTVSIALKPTKISSLVNPLNSLSITSVRSDKISSTIDLPFSVGISEYRDLTLTLLIKSFLIIRLSSSDTEDLVRWCDVSRSD